MSSTASEPRYTAKVGFGLGTDVRTLQEFQGFRGEVVDEDGRLVWFTRVYVDRKVALFQANSSKVKLEAFWRKNGTRLEQVRAVTKTERRIATIKATIARLTDELEKLQHGDTRV